MGDLLECSSCKEKIDLGRSVDNVLLVSTSSKYNSSLISARNSPIYQTSSTKSFESTRSLSSLEKSTFGFSATSTPSHSDEQLKSLNNGKHWQTMISSGEECVDSISIGSVKSADGDYHY
jgi:hypothetical protein